MILVTQCADLTCPRFCTGLALLMCPRHIGRKRFACPGRKNMHVGRKHFVSPIPGRLRCERLLDHRINDGKIANQFLRDGVAISQVGDAVCTHPDLLIRTLPDEDFEGQIKCEQRGGNHEWRAAFRIAKDQHVGLLHRESDPSRFATMVNLGKEGQIVTVYGLLKAL